MMHFLVSADRKWNPSYVRPNPDFSWDWCPSKDIDPFNDVLVAIDGERGVVHETLIEAGVRMHHAFGIDGVTKDVQWAWARDYLGGVLN